MTLKEVHYFNRRRQEKLSVVMPKQPKQRTSQGRKGGPSADPRHVVRHSFHSRAPLVAPRSPSARGSPWQTQLPFRLHLYPVIAPWTPPHLVLQPSARRDTA